jgi:hypothetical protein
VQNSSGKTLGKCFVFIPIGVFVLLFIAGVVARFFQEQPAPILDPIIMTLSTLLLLSFLALIVTVPIGIVIWWKNGKAKSSKSFPTAH